jgi:NtrC-family two-component system response regulator AlgB
MDNATLPTCEALGIFTSTSLTCSSMQPARQQSSNLALRILVVDDELNIRTQLSLFLEAEGHHVVAHATIHEALIEASWQAFDLVFLDLRLGMDNGLDFIPRLIAESPWAKIVVITAYASIDTAVESMRRGAADYLPKPFTPAQVRVVTEKIAERRLLERRVEALQLALGNMDAESAMPTKNAAMARAIELASQVATSQATVLIRGENGTGKGRLARAIHDWSNRAAAPFATALCQTTSADVLDAEVFGLSMKDRQDSIVEAPGWVEFCEGGTLHLEEIGETPPSLQPKLLRLLRDREYERFNDFKMRRTNVRLIASTSIDLESEVRRGRFRTDLLLTLDVIRIDIPPLRQRVEDVGPLASRYLAHFARESHRSIGGFTPAAMAALEKHGWPGNVRELRNVVERAVLVCKQDEIGVEHLPSNLLNSPCNYTIGDLVPLEVIQDLHIRKVVSSTRTIASAANILGVHSATIIRRMKRFGKEVSPTVADPPSLDNGATVDRPAD